MYNRYWTTKGGGEQNAASYASVLAEEHDVELVGVEHFDVEKLAESLGQPSIRKLPLRVIGQHPTAATEASKDYDLWICHSYISDDYSLARFGIYVTMFPQNLDYSSLTRRKSKVTFEFDVKVHDEYADRVVLSESGGIRIRCREKNRLTLVAHGADGQIELIDRKKKKVIETAKTSDRKSIHALTLPKGDLLLRFRANNKESLSFALNVDCLRLADGMRVVDSRQISNRNLKPVFTSSYDSVISISEYTSQWVLNKWGIESHVHYPAVDVRHSEVRSREKEKIILSVGRFFSEEHGHSKQQLKLVDAFQKMISNGLNGWRLVLIGGCDANNRDYAMAVKNAAIGSPIDVILNADPEVLNSYLEKSSVYWHATGLGMDLGSHPEKAEHFGIAPVEAMSTGCIPVLFGIGGTAELVDDGNSGFTFLDSAELIEKTFEIVNSGKETQDKLRENAIEKANLFSKQRFNLEFRDLIAQIVKSVEN